MCKSSAVACFLHTNKNRPACETQVYFIKWKQWITPIGEQHVPRNSPLPIHLGASTERLQMLAAKGDDTGGEMIRFLQILFFIGLDHQFVHHYYITVR